MIQFLSNAVRSTAIQTQHITNNWFKLVASSQLSNIVAGQIVLFQHFCLLYSHFFELSACSYVEYSLSTRRRNKLLTYTS